MAKEKIDRAKELRKTIERLAQNLSDNDALDNIELFPNWKINQQYRVGYKVRFRDKLYRVTEDHLSVDEKNPADAGLLFSQIYYIEPDVPRPWVKPTDLNPYSIGDLVIFENETYKSLINNTMWSPSEYPIAWEKV